MVKLKLNGTYIFEIINKTIVPSAKEDLAVMNDNDSRYITFKIPSVIDGIDITDKVMTVRYVNALNQYDQFFANDRQLITDGNEQFVLFDWVLGSKVTSAKGNVTYDISIYDNADISNTNQYIFHTKPSTLIVDDGLLDIGEPVEDENALQEAIDSFNVTAAKYYNLCLEQANNAKSYSDEAKKSADKLKTDTTLTISGYAADAKTVGDQLANKANASDVRAMISRTQSTSTDVVQVGTQSTTSVQTYASLNILASAGYIALRSPNGTEYHISIDNTGTLKAVKA